MSLEALVTAGGKKTFASSGPGPKTLVGGDSTLGYFGPVPVAELFTSSEIAQQYPEMAGFGTMVWGVDLQWQKFIINGKIVYIALVAMNTGCRWTDLYANGMIYGTNDNGQVPEATPVNQFRPLTKRVNGEDWVLTIRTMRISADDVLPTSTLPGLDAAALLNVIKQGVGRGTGKWGQLNPTDLSYNWTLNTYTNTTGALVHGINSGVSYGSKTGVIRYFPVLDLQDASKVVLPITQPRGTLVGPGIPVVSGKASFADAILPLDVSTLSYSMSALKAPMLGRATKSDMVMPPTTVTYQPYFKQPMMTVKIS